MVHPGAGWLSLRTVGTVAFKSGHTRYKRLVQVVSIGSEMKKHLLGILAAAEIAAAPRRRTLVVNFMIEQREENPK